jgi:hypothetical protein
VDRSRRVWGRPNRAGAGRRGGPPGQAAATATCRARRGTRRSPTAPRPATCRRSRR